MLIALLVMSSLVFGWHYFLWRRLVRDAELPPLARRIATAALVLLGASLPAIMMAQRSLPRVVLRPLAFFAYGWMGLAFFLFFALLIGELVRPVIGAALRAKEPNVDRRLALSRIVGGLGAAVGLGEGTYGLTQALGAIPVEQVTILLRRLPERLSGLTIVQISDVHIGPTMGRTWLAGVVAKVNALSPDVVAITGDLVDGSVDDLRNEIAPLGELRAKHGVFFVTGNHEYYSGAEAWCAHLRSLGVRVLDNERVRIGGERDGQDDGASFDLAGVNDFNAPARGHDLAKALAGRDPSRELVLLAHQPRSITEAAAHGVGLQLSGHTHAGQMFPWNLLVKLQQPFVAGLHRVRDTWVYVHRGTGFWGPPMRVGAAPEIARIELRSPSVGGRG